MARLTKKTLYDVCETVTDGEDVRGLVDDMMAVITTGRGIGLAANQIGSNKRVIAVYAGGLHQVFVNPVITKRYGGKKTSKEGCLSFPGMIATVVRDRQIVIEGFTPSWEPIKRKLKGLAAICAQHEIDHLDGITCIKREKEREI